MEKKLIISEDGSHTFFVPEFGQHYHSSHGAIQESMHVFINSGLSLLKKNSIRIFEMGFGSGLNALLSWKYAIDNSCTLFYNTIELYPISRDEAAQINYPDILNLPREMFLQLHAVEWDKHHKLDNTFNFFKTNSDLRSFSPAGIYDLIYFDAFSPESQPDLWETPIFKVLFDVMADGGILTSYSVRGDFRRSLKEVGFTVEKIPGPPGKRHITRAWK